MQKCLIYLPTPLVKGGRGRWNVLGRRKENEEPSKTEGAGKRREG